ncbi:hypothetical protein [Telluribacter humicola]
MYSLELSHTANGNIIGRCVINDLVITSNPQSEIPDVLDEILYIARSYSGPLDKEPVFDVVWANEEEEIKCSSCKHILPKDLLTECSTCGEYLCSLCTCTQCQSVRGADYVLSKS